MFIMFVLLWVFLFVVVVMYYYSDGFDSVK